ncbi:peptide-methionine (S)-S-oxide reductase MsrA [Hyphomonas sp. WL0036]|uniref:peptide-methionine (S)-S-oxide reductase MsrA n=1 Tax=Hyphomonas sediminis TaxID=2866160 RepID=UPI001C811F34|nr:peptide-methionine (S)-S-oxide reductase MsrA [Hyphomonas sediminis]MBY9065863.1 peptide-methionine (S)-S-oxide reductase MsrA [Hyphomonas sediminis]
MRLALIAAAIVSLAACNNAVAVPPAAATEAAHPEAAAHEEVAIFAGGCFWCIEAELEEVPGVRTVISGYTGGTTPDPTYKRMGDHAEAVEVIYDPAKVTYPQLLEVFWSNIDPTDEGGQFYDRGSQYRTAIYVLDETQANAARASLEANAKRLKQPIATAVLPATEFYPAEDYHQDYYLKEPGRYEAYKKASGREKTLKEVWQGD